MQSIHTMTPSHCNWGADLNMLKFQPMKVTPRDISTERLIYPEKCKHLLIVLATNLIKTVVH